MLKRQHVYAGFLILAALGPACSGDDGKDGAIGPAGAQGKQGDPGEKGDKGDPGPQGPAGPEGPQGPAGSSTAGAGAGGEPTGMAGAANTPGLSAGCLSPCHGFTGLVEQWKTSTHFATYIANLGGEEVDSWTGTQACGNCHANDAIQQRLDGNVRHIGDNGPVNVAHGQINYLNSKTSKIAEATYAGHSMVAVVHCTTCHNVTDENDPHRTGKAYEPGSFPLRVPTGSDEQAYIEKSSAVGVSDGTPAGKYGVGNACMWCHKSRKDVTNFITASNSLTSVYWGPHEGPQTDIFTGEGGYHYAGKTYDNSSHQGLKKGCVSCHMPGDAAVNEGIGDHSFAAKLSACSKGGCHDKPTSFDIVGAQTAMKSTLRELRQALNDKGWLTRATTAPFDALTPAQLADDNFAQDVARPNPTALNADNAGALYNYFLIARGAAGGIHNPLYVKQLIFDSYFAVVGSKPSTLPNRPAK